MIKIKYITSIFKYKYFIIINNNNNNNMIIIIIKMLQIYIILNEWYLTSLL